MILTAEKLNDAFNAADEASGIEKVVAESMDLARAAAFELGQRLEQVVDFGDQSAESFMDDLADDLEDGGMSRKDALASVVKFVEGKLSEVEAKQGAVAPKEKAPAKELV